MALRSIKKVMSHDQNFKNLLLDYPHQALAFFATTEALVLERQLRVKFGVLPDAVQQRIEQASEQTPLEWSERILTASRLDEVLH